MATLLAQKTTGYDGHKGPRMQTKGGRPPTQRDVLCVNCHQPLGRRYGSPAVRSTVGLAHRECRVGRDVD